MRNKISTNATQVPEISASTSPGEPGPFVKKVVRKTGTTTLPTKVANVGAPQVVQPVSENITITSILKELKAIQNVGPQKYCIIGTRHCSYLHQQIVELVSYALVLTGNHIYTSGSGGTNAAAIRGALRAERPDLLTVVLPQSLKKQPADSRTQLEEVQDVIENPLNDHLPLDVASRLCNSDLITRIDHLISFAYHDSDTVIEAIREASGLEKVVVTLYLD